MASTDARPVPIKNTAFRVTFPILDNDGDPVSGAAGLDSEVSKDGGAFADCTNEATEIGSSGFYYLDLTATEMNADTVAVQVKTSTTDAKTQPLVFYPQELGDMKVDVQSLLGTAWLAPAVAGTPDVNAKQIGGTAQTGRDVGAALPEAAPGAVNGLLISGSNAGTSQIGRRVSSPVRKLDRRLRMAEFYRHAAIKTSRTDHILQGDIAYQSEADVVGAAIAVVADRAQRRC